MMVDRAVQGRPESTNMNGTSKFGIATGSILLLLLSVSGSASAFVIEHAGGGGSDPKMCDGYAVVATACTYCHQYSDPAQCREHPEDWVTCAYMVDGKCILS
jgi:hypothetical protein